MRASSGNASSTTVVSNTPRTNRSQQVSGEAARSYQDSKKPNAATSPAKNSRPKQLAILASGRRLSNNRRTVTLT